MGLVLSPYDGWRGLKGGGRLEIALIVSLLMHIGVVFWDSADRAGFVVEPSPRGTAHSGKLSGHLVMAVNVAPKPSSGWPRLAQSRRQVRSYSAEREQFGLLDEGGGFVTPEQLDRLPEALGEIVLDPEDGFMQITEGSAELQVLILETGKVGLVSVNYSSFAEEYNHWLTERFAQSKFVPGFKGGLPVKTLIRVDVVVVP